MTHDTDVLIVGLGPTGATLAALLAQRGVRVAVFDRQRDTYPLPRAIGCDHEALRIWQGLGLADRLAPHLAAYRPSEYRGAQGQLIKRLDMAPPPHRLGWAPNWVFDQPAVERVLRQHLATLPGVHLALGHEVTACDTVGAVVSAAVAPAGATAMSNPTRDDHGVLATVRAPDGCEQRWRARWAVACDGGASAIRKRLGIALDDLHFDETWLVVDAHVQADALAALPQTQVQYCEPQRPSSFIVGPGNLRRWELMLLPGEHQRHPSHGPWPEDPLWPLLARWIRPGQASLWRAAAYRFHGLVAERWRVGRILLAGDAAHMTPPFMAQGMVQGLRDAANLAWKLERVLRHGAPEALLDSYQAERKPHVEATTRAAIGLGRLICERDAVAAQARDDRLLAEHGGCVPTTVRQSMLPELKSGLIDASSAGAGSLFPQPWVRTAASAEPRLLDDLSGHGIRVLAMEAALTPDQAAAITAALAPLQGHLLRLAAARGQADADIVAAAAAAASSCDSAGNEPGSLHITEQATLMNDWLRSLDAAFAIVRPDHQVYATARDTAGALRHVARLAALLSAPPAAPADAPQFAPPLATEQQPSSPGPATSTPACNHAITAP